MGGRVLRRMVLLMREVADVHDQTLLLYLYTSIHELCILLAVDFQCSFGDRSVFMRFERDFHRPER